MNKIDQWIQSDTNSVILLYVNVRNLSDDFFYQSAQQFSPPEIQRLGGETKDSLSAREHFAGRAIVRKLAIRVTGNLYGSETITTKCQWCGCKLGRPRLEPQIFSFSIAHSQGLVVVAAAFQGEIGVDVEKHLTEVSQNTVMQWAMTEKELCYARQVSEDRLPEYLANIWALKESALKLVGRGLSISPATIDTTCSPIYLELPGSKSTRSAVFMKTVSVADGFSAALSYTLAMDESPILLDAGDWLAKTDERYEE
ncbi:4'-phosphopantetheinyl transferase family protein (plasmid) [Glutamicibacter sp. FR1]|uniref:4'-phosphopantetheinyl transferase family protein n=1 Tax=Glutamicibacter sp. FR1 TaxID=3393744 RepID=UPI0039AFC757